MKTSGNFSQSATFDTVEEALKFINDAKCPVDGFVMSGMSVYPNYVYDKKTGKYDYTKRVYQCSVSWNTPLSKEDAAHYDKMDAMPIQLPID